MSTDLDVSALLSKLEEKYKDKGLASDFEDDRHAYGAFLPSLIETWHELGLELTRLVAVGTSGSVWQVHDRNLERDNALKLSHPRLSRLPFRGVRAEIAEPRTLAALNHQNVVRVYFAKECAVESEALGKYQFAFFTMDYLDGIGDFDQYIVDHRSELSATQVIQLFRDALNGIAYLHKRGIIHCDIKPANMFIAPTTPALIGDLGYSKKLLESSGERADTTAKFTEKYAHPKLREYITERQREGGAEATISRALLRHSFDLFAFGRSMQQVLEKLSQAAGDTLLSEERRPGQDKSFTRRQWLYLSCIARRLLDGECENPEFDIIPGLTRSVMKEIRYRTADEALEDFEKLLGLYDLEGNIPELRPDIAEYIQIPHAKVPHTKRVSDVINHPAVARLTTVTQLGFVSMVYPGASHTRFEHALGTFTHCSIYLRSLWYDEVNPLFQSIMTADDLEAALLAALLHDIGQYPMAHDLHEVADAFSPDAYTRQFLCYRHPGAELSLDDLIRAAWGGRDADAAAQPTAVLDIAVTKEDDTGSASDVQPDIVDRMLGIMRGGTEAAFKERVLHSLISGPYDCDKIDYLQRDSTHLGVNFGHAIDCERLVRNLTLVYKPEPLVHHVAGLNTVRDQAMQVVGVGVTEKGLAAAQVVCRAREDMFRQVYWQHSVRALKAMLGYVVRTTWFALDNLARGDLRRELYEMLLGFPSTAKVRVEETSPHAPEDEFLGDDWVNDNRQEIYGRQSILAPNDDAILGLFYKFTDATGRKVIRDIRQRRLFRRFSILSHPVKKARASENDDREEAWYLQIYSEFKRKRTSEPKSLERDRLRWEGGFIEAVETALREAPELLNPDETALGVASAMKASSPVMLVDVPVKSLETKSGPELIWYLPEELTGIHARQLGPLPSVESITVDLSDSEFDRRVGKIRVFVAPEWSTITSKCLNAASARKRNMEHEIWDLIAKVIPASDE